MDAYIGEWHMHVLYMYRINFGLCVLHDFWCTWNQYSNDRTMRYTTHVIVLHSYTNIEYVYVNHNSKYHKVYAWSQHSSCMRWRKNPFKSISLQYLSRPTKYWFISIMYIFLLFSDLIGQDIALAGIIIAVMQ